MNLPADPTVPGLPALSQADGENTLVVMTKRPRPGYVKTRLAHHIGDEAACKLHVALVQHTLEACGKLHAQRILALTPDTAPDHTPSNTRPDSKVPLATTPSAARGSENHPASLPDLPHCPPLDCPPLDYPSLNWQLTGQGGGDLGDRLQRLFRTLLRSEKAEIRPPSPAPGPVFDCLSRNTSTTSDPSGQQNSTRDMHPAKAARVVVIGTDCPWLQPAHVRAAWDLLNEAPVVLGPAHDGGYYLIGLVAPWRPAYAALFTDMPWGGETVAASTREACRQQGLTWRELPTLRDIDRPEDLEYLRADCHKGTVANETLRQLMEAF